MDTIVNCEALTRRFGAATAVDRLSFSVTPGEIFGVVGPDGAGKTTTLRMLAAILDPSDGAATVAGFDTVRDAEAVKERIGYMSQRFGLYSDLTVLENLCFYADLFCVPKRGRPETIARLLGFSNLTPFAHRLAGNLSGGMKQKLGLACTLIHKPMVLLLDEPTNGVDPVSRRDFWRILYQLLREGVTIIVSTSYLDEAERCNRLALLHNGALLACGTPDGVKEQMGAAVIEVRTDSARRAASVLRGALTAVSIDLFGDRVHIVAHQPEETTRAARQALDAAGITLESMRQIEPALEDVFIAMLAREEASADEQRG